MYIDQEHRENWALNSPWKDHTNAHNELETVLIITQIKSLDLPSHVLVMIGNYALDEISYFMTALL